MPGRRVTMHPGIRPALVRHARRERPRECCGLLVGRGRHVAFVVAADNLESSASRFRVDDRAHIALRRALRGFTPELAVIGAYHSHPRGRARPSERDVRESMYPDWIHVIIGLAGRTPEIRAFTLASGRATPLPIRWRASPVSRAGR